MVISIIGFLSSIVLAALSGARQKGTIGSAQEFASANYHAAGVNALVIYNFNDIKTTVANTTTADGSGNNFNATIYNCTVSPYCGSTQTPSGAGYALSHLAAAKRLTQPSATYQACRKAP